MWTAFIVMFIVNVHQEYLCYDKHVDNQKFVQEYISTLELGSGLSDVSKNNFTLFLQENNSTAEVNSPEHEDMREFHFIIFAFCFIILGGLCALAKGGFSG